MYRLINTAIEPVIPTEEDARVAGEACQVLAPLLEAPGFDGKILLRVRARDGLEKEVELPPSLLPLLVAILQEFAKGCGVTLLPLRAEPASRRTARDEEQRRRLDALSEAVEETGVYDRFVQEEAPPT